MEEAKLVEVLQAKERECQMLRQQAIAALDGAKTIDDANKEQLARLQAQVQLLEKERLADIKVQAGAHQTTSSVKPECRASLSPLANLICGFAT